MRISEKSWWELEARVCAAEQATVVERCVVCGRHGFQKLLDVVEPQDVFSYTYIHPECRGTEKYDRRKKKR